MCHVTLLAKLSGRGGLANRLIKGIAIIALRFDKNQTAAAPLAYRIPCCEHGRCHRLLQSNPLHSHNAAQIVAAAGVWCLITSVNLRQTEGTVRGRLYTWLPTAWIPIQK
jgi:hypothetical protein